MPMASLSWFAGMYIAAYLAWAKIFRAWLDPWLRSRIGALMGVTIVWVDALRFPMHARIWGVVPPADELTETHVGLLAAGVMFGAAMLPIVALSLVLSLTTWLPERMAHALYLVSVALIVVFLRGVTHHGAEGG